MKSLARWFWLSAVVAVFALPAKAGFVDSRITPNDLVVSGLAFDIKTNRLPDGLVHFLVQVTSKNGDTLNDTVEQRTGANLCFITKTAQEESSTGFATLPVKKNDQSLTCEFVVRESWLADPTLCFEFARSSAHFPSGDGYYAVLRDFDQPEPAVPSQMVLALAGLAVGLLLVGFGFWWGRRPRAVHRDTLHIARPTLTMASDPHE